ncbi:GNAT family N-acetyltransferase [Spirosoma foliorum]|uniref:GNAT family N-acetyltransferase n=1 Tax=Spirosoma foliorum TaxID=2710596 RepID=A0A7G5H3C2_9BACT|nr:GNAT family N-acetyltransferase [Spirosoma foliorum]QMW05614.1 GNAT family N-acetyltransferase [Spirosoma foliorum]
MHFLPITEPHPYLNTIQTWYEDSFPVDERRDFADLVTLLPCPDMHLCALLDTPHQLVGFIIYWQWSDILFVEHFAIDPTKRGQQFGQQALEQLVRMAYTYLILEVERPEDELSQRRVRFYERQGFTLNLFDYFQPPYQLGNTPIPMRLMSTPAITNHEDFERFSQLIKTQVYERFYRR